MLQLNPPSSKDPLFERQPYGIERYGSYLPNLINAADVAPW